MKKSSKLFNGAAIGTIIGILLFSSFVAFAESSATSGGQAVVPIGVPGGPKLLGPKKLPPNSTGLKHRKRRFKSSRSRFKDSNRGLFSEDTLPVDDASPKADLTITKVKFKDNIATVYVKNIGTVASPGGVAISGHTEYTGDVGTDGWYPPVASWNPRSYTDMDQLIELPSIAPGSTYKAIGSIGRTVRQTKTDETTGETIYGETFTVNRFSASIHNFPTSVTNFPESDYDNNSIAVDLPPE